MKRRPALLRLHLLLGFTLAAALCIESLSGAVLIFRGEIGNAVDPAPARPGPGTSRAPLQALLDAARLQHPGARPNNLVLPEREEQAARVGMTDADGEAIEVFVDPRTAGVLASRWQERSPLHALWLLHSELYMGPRGSVGVALIGAGLLAQSATGLYLWWPFVRRPAHRFTIRWPRPWPVVSYDVHKAVGALSLAFNVPIALTGLLLALALGAAQDDQRGSGAAGPRSSSSPLPLDDIARAADAALPGGRITSLRFMLRAEGAIEVRKRMPGDIDPRGGSAALVDSRSGALIAVHDARRSPPAARLWSLVAPLHFGDFGGIASKLVYAAGALASPVLVVTGLLIWFGRPSPDPEREPGRRPRQVAR